MQSACGIVLQDVECNVNMRSHYTYHWPSMTSGSSGEDDPGHIYTPLDRECSS